MSSYKASLSRPQPNKDSTESKYRQQAQQLQELFPTWSNEDLQALLTDVSGDVQVAATRITEGHAVQWGSVTRKKDKKQAPTHSHKDSISASGSRGDIRGGRGGARGGRGGAGRGGAASARGARSGGRGGAAGVNGHAASPSVTAGTSWANIAGNTPDSNSVSAAVDSPDASAKPPAATVDNDTTVSAWANSSGGAQASSVSTAGWPSGTGTAVTPSTWGDGEPNGNGHAAHGRPAVKSSTSKPATSKMSWAQIARPQEKPTPAPAPTPAPPAISQSASAPTPMFDSISVAPSEPISTAATGSSIADTEASQGWEDPTTAQAPTWDEEPKAAPEPWVTETSEEEVVELEAEPEAEPQVEEPEVTPEPEVVVVPEPEVEAPPAPAPIPQPSPAPIPAKAPRTAPASHRSSAAARYKNADSPVIMPSSLFGSAGKVGAPIGFGSTSPGIGGLGMGVEKVGMQFGSLSLGGDSFDASEPQPLSADEPSLPDPQPVQAQQAHEPTPVIPATQPAPLSNGSALFQQSLPQQIQPPQHSLPTPQAQAPVQAVLSPIPPFGLSNHQQQQQAQLPPHQQPQQVQQTHQQYAQHGLPTHLDPTQGQIPQQQQQPSPQQQHQISQAQQAQTQQGGQHSSYFRQPETTPYFHSPTPPAGQGQDSPYGAFGQLAHGLGQVQHQQHQHAHQGQNHLGGFAADYGYAAETQRGFYDSYGQQSTGFGNRNVLGHDDVKGLPSAQQQQGPASAALPTASAQSAQQHPGSAQGGAQPQPSAGQGPQQAYPPPLPYYYPYPQNQYYGTPYNSAYGVPQQFVKYPTMFQPGPPGPGSPAPAAKQGPTTVPPQSNPYGQSLYGQQAAYDESAYQHHTPQHQHQHSHAQSPANLPSNDYSKHQQQLYGGAQGIQGFMGLGQSTGPSSGPPLGQRAGGGSPETSYKPYAPNGGAKDVGTGGIGQGVGQQQTRGGAQQGQGAFYGNNRFGAGSAAAGPQGQQGQPQGQAPQAGYPGTSDNNFYSYQRQQQQQQQGYWQ